MPFSLLNAEAMPDWFLDSNKRGNMLDNFQIGSIPNVNFPRVFTQVATSQMCNFPSGNFPNVQLTKR